MPVSALVHWGINGYAAADAPDANIKLARRLRHIGKRGRMISEMLAANRETPATQADLALSRQCGNLPEFKRVAWTTMANGIVIQVPPSALLTPQAQHAIVFKFSE